MKSLPYDKATEEVKRIEEWAIRLGVEEGNPRYPSWLMSNSKGSPTRQIAEHTGCFY